MLSPILNKKRIKSSILALSLSIFAFESALAAPQSHPGSIFSSDEGEITQDVIKLLSAEHYQYKNINDVFSISLYDNYLKALDPARIFFLESDIQRLDKYKTTLDDEVLAGNLASVSDIYRTFSKQYGALLKYTVENMDDLVQGFDFTKVDEMLIDRKDAPRPKTYDDSQRLWLKRIKNEALNLKLANKDKEEISKILLKRYESRLGHFEKTTTDDIYEGFINELTALYDPHTTWMSPRALENFKINMSLSLEGIGAVLQKDDEYTKVIRLVTGGPAAKQGQLKAGDRIIGVAQGKDGEFEDIVGWRLDEVVQIIRGKESSIVRLEVLNNPEDTPKIVEIVREKVKLEDQAAKKTIINVPSGESERRIGIISIPGFYMDFEAYRRGDPKFKSTTRDVVLLLNELMDAKIDGLVIDLRNNGGGSLREATTLTDLFIDRGPVVQIRDSDDQISRRYRSQHSPFYTGPLLVLTNEFSASASEIFAGAIQDYQRGLVVGGQSFGKGTVQTLSELEQGQLKYTTSKFYRVSGDSTQNRGVIPDISYPSIFDLEEVGEQSLDNALPWDTIHPISHVKYSDIKPKVQTLTSNHQQRMDNDPDYRYLLDRIAYIEEQKDINILSLNEETRKSEKVEANDTILKLTNIMRSKKGLEPFKTFDDFEDDQDEKSAKANSATTIDVDNDFLLRESAHILSDFIDMNKGIGQPAIADVNTGRTGKKQ